MKCKQSKAEIAFLKRSGLKGYDDKVNGEYFGQLEDKEEVLFGHIPDVVLIHRRSLQILMVDHKTCPLNGRTSKRTADIERKKKEDRGYLNFAMTDSWSNSFHQKDLIQKAVARVSLGAHYAVVVLEITKDMRLKNLWVKKNPFVILITEEELIGVLDEYQEIDNSIGNFLLDGRGAIIPSFPEIINKSKTFKAVTSKGVETFEAEAPTREGVKECHLRVTE
jgi:hypothetical protein